MPERTVRMSDLTPARRRLVAEMQRLGYGHIEGLLVRNGEPQFGAHTAVRKIKLGADNRPRPALDDPGMVLKQTVVELLDHLAALGDGVIRCLQLQDGLPTCIEIEERPSPEPGLAAESAAPAQPPNRTAAVDKVTEHRR